MEVLGALFDTLMSILRFEITVFGFTFSFFRLFAFSVVVGIVAKFLWGAVFDAD